MRRTSVGMLVVAILGLTLSVRSAPAQVVATVDGVPITEVDLQLAEDEIGARLANLPANVRRGVLVDYVVDNQLMAAAARATGVERDPAFASRLPHYLRRALVDAWVQKEGTAKAQVTDARRLYDAGVAEYKPVEEVRISHIQLENEAQAILVRGEIEKGADFAAVAQAVSADYTTNSTGGDLGYFAKGEMQAWAEAAVFTLGRGEVSRPLKSPQGWHLVKVEDRRLRAIPPFDALKDRIVSQLVEQNVQRSIAALRQKANIVIPSAASPAGSPR